jgi:hypothetical protein
VGPALAPAKRLLNGDEGPFLIDNMAGGVAFVDMLQGKGAPAQGDFARELTNDMIKPRRG